MAALLPELYAFPSMAPIDTPTQGALGITWGPQTSSPSQCSECSGTRPRFPKQSLATGRPFSNAGGWDGGGINGSKEEGTQQVREPFPSRPAPFSSNSHRTGVGSA